MMVKLSNLVFSLCQKRQLHINTNFVVTEYILCVIPQICKYAKYHWDSDHRKQVNNLIKTFFHRLSEDEMAVIPDIFWAEYTDFDDKNCSFDGDECIWKSKDIIDGNRQLWHQKYSLPCTKVIVFVACRFTSNILGIGAAERY